MEFITFAISAVKTTEMQVAVVSFMLSALAYKMFRGQQTSDKPNPPGPWGFPILGYMPLMGKEPNVKFMKMREKFGDIFQIKMGSWPVVVVNGKQAIREALQTSGDDFSGRPQFVSSKIMQNGESLGLGYYDNTWKIHRKLADKAVSEFSSAMKNPIQDMVEEEVDILIDCFVSPAGKSFDPRDYLFISVASIIYQICFGRKQNIRESNDFESFLSSAGEFSRFIRVGNPVDILPWLQYIMPNRSKKFASYIEKRRIIRAKQVDEHKETPSPDHVRDLTDGLLAVSKAETRLTEDRILSTIDTVFGAGFDTITYTLLWTLMLMAAHPDVQRRVQAELDDILGGRRPGIQDRGSLIYTQAVLHEINRYVSLAPFTIPHSAVRDTQLGGYSIKKDTILFINLYSMSYDKAVWGDPDVFRPERFLDESGQIKKFLLGEFLPFSAGNRKCMGELLAKTEVFLFLSGLLQRCSIIKPPEVNEYSMDVDPGLARQCLPFTIQVQLRN